MALTVAPGDTVFVLRALGLGDFLTAVPALRGLRRHFPAARLLLGAHAAYRDLALWSGAVDDVVPTRHLGDVAPLQSPPAVAVNLHGSGPQSIDHLLDTHPRTLITHRHPDRGRVDGLPWRSDLHEVDRWCRLLAAAGIDCDGNDLRIDRPPGYPDRSGVVVVHPGAASAARRWPVDRFAAVAARLARAGYRVVVTGSAAERHLALAVATNAGLPESAVLAGELDLLGLVALIGGARLVVCGDTGVAHVATATGTPSVVLFGPTPPSRWGPRGDGRHVALWSGGTGDPHADRPDSGLLALSIVDVLDATETVLERCA